MRKQQSEYTDTKWYCKQKAVCICKLYTLFAPLTYDMLIEVCTHACFSKIFKKCFYIAPSAGYLSTGKGLTHHCVTAVLSIKDKKSNSRYSRQK